MNRNSIFYLCMGISITASSLSINSIVLAGMGILSIILSLFENKNYNNKRLIFAVAIVILAISLVLTYFQLLSPSYSGNKLVNYSLAIIFTIMLIAIVYDFTHNYKISEIFDRKDQQLRDQSQLTKDSIAITLLIIGLITGLLLGIYWHILF